MSDPIVSHGRGGTGNIGKDTTPYMDGEIVREGPIGDTNQGAFSTGRGGTGNIGSPGMKPVHRDSQDVIPETAMRPSMEDRDYHVGRGGQGNAHLAHEEKDKATHEGLADKLKNKIFKPKKADGSTSPENV